MRYGGDGSGGMIRRKRSEVAQPSSLVIRARFRQQFRSTAGPLFFKQLAGIIVVFVHCPFTQPQLTGQTFGLLIAAAAVARDANQGHGVRPDGLVLPYAVGNLIWAPLILLTAASVARHDPLPPLLRITRTQSNAAITAQGMKPC